MKLHIRGGRLVDPATGTDQLSDLAISGGRIEAIGALPAGFVADRVLDATGCVVAPGLVDLCARLKEPGMEHARMLESELAAAAAGGVTSLVCPPDTDPVLDEPGLVEMLKSRAKKLSRCRLFPLGALTRQLEGAQLTELVQLTESGCVGFSQAERGVKDIQVLMRSFQYAATYGYTLWLRPQDPWLGKGVAASGPVATRLGLPSVPVIAETLAMHTCFELMRATGAKVHLCRISSAAGVELLRQAKKEGLPVTADVSIHSIHLTDMDIGYFDSRMRLEPPLRQARDRDALRQALADGTIDALVSDHHPVSLDEKTLPFGEATPGATGLELLLSLALRWGQDMGLSLAQTLAAVTVRPVSVMGARMGGIGDSAGRIHQGGVADLCIFDPETRWAVQPHMLKSQSHCTPFEFERSGFEMQGRVRWTCVAGAVAFENPQEAN